MCFLLCDQFLAPIYGHQDRYVLFSQTYELAAQKGRQLKKVSSFFRPRCNTGRFLYGLPDLA